MTMRKTRRLLASLERPNHAANPIKHYIGALLMRQGFPVVYAEATAQLEQAYEQCATTVFVAVARHRLPRPCSM